MRLALTVLAFLGLSLALKLPYSSRASDCKQGASACVIGEYYRKKGSSCSCLACPTGRYSLGGTTSCKTCPFKSYAINYGHPGASPCVSCKPGFGPSKSGQFCEQCSKGKYRSGNMRSCGNCASGRTSNKHSTACKYTGYKPIKFSQVAKLSRTGTLVSIKSYNYPNNYIRHAGWVGFIHKYSSKALYKMDATFVIVKGLIGTDTISFRSVNYPTHYLRHAGWRLRLHKYSTAALYKKDASFKVVSALYKPSGGVSKGWVSFQSYNYPKAFIRHANYKLYVGKFHTSALYKKDATFKFVPNLYVKPIITQYVYSSCQAARRKNLEFLDRQDANAGAGNLIRGWRLIGSGCGGNTMRTQTLRALGVAGSCGNSYSTCQAARHKKLEFFDRQSVGCANGQALQRWRLTGCGRNNNMRTWKRCCTIRRPFKVERCFTRWTSCQQARNEPLEFLDRQPVFCGAGEVLKWFRLTGHGCSGRTMRTQMHCCKLKYIGIIPAEAATTALEGAEVNVAENSIVTPDDDDELQQDDAVVPQLPEVPVGVNGKLEDEMVAVEAPVEIPDENAEAELTQENSAVQSEDTPTEDLGDDLMVTSSELPQLTDAAGKVAWSVWIAVAVIGVLMAAVAAFVRRYRVTNKQGALLENSGLMGQYGSVSA